MAIKYVSSKFGNNDNDGSTLKKAYLTVQYAIQHVPEGDFIHIYDGTYFEQNIVASIQIDIIGVGNVVFNGTIFNAFKSATSSFLRATNITFINYRYLSAIDTAASLTFTGCFILNCGNTSSYSVWNNITKSVISSNKDWLFKGTTIINNSTFYGTGVINFENTVGIDNNISINNIFVKTPISIDTNYICKCKFWHFIPLFF